MIRETEGDETLQRFIQTHEQMAAAPVVLSDAFPAGLLPRPILEPLSIEARRKFAADIRFGATQKERHQGLKALKKHSFLSIERLKSLASRDLDEAAVVVALLKDEKASDAKREASGEPFDIQSEAALIPHVSLNRVNNRALQGQLFSEEARFFSQTPKTHHFEIWGAASGFCA